MEEPALLCASDIQQLLEDERAAFGEVPPLLLDPPPILDHGDLPLSVTAHHGDHLPPLPNLPNGSGQEVQRISVINNLASLLRDSNVDCMRRVVPKVREVLHVAQSEMQLAACTTFLQILQKQLVPLGNYTQTFLQTILMAMDSRDPEVANAWLDTLLDVIDLLPKDIIKHDILSKAIAKGQISQSVQSRLACCRILGKIATKCEPFVIKKEILPVVQSLCQDVEYEVRGCMCRQLDPVARGLGLEATKNAILPELVELTKDEESYVRLAGIETVVNVLSLLDDDTRVNIIIPLVCKFCDEAFSQEDVCLPAVAMQLGHLCLGLQSNLTDDQKRWLLDFYKKICRYGAAKARKKQQELEAQSPDMPKNQFAVSMFPAPDTQEDMATECRRNAGYNFPAMVLFTGARSFKSELHSTFQSLCTDPHFLVRKTVACGFHEVGKLLGASIQLIQPDFITLLKDDSLEVLGGVVAQLPETLEMFSKGASTTVTELKTSALTEVIPALLHCDNVVFASNNWRLQVEVMDKLAFLPCCFTSDQIYHKFIPLLVKKLHTARAMPVRLAAAKTLLILVRNIRKLEQRNDICQKLIQDLCHGRSCRLRSLFIDVCQLVMEHFSRSFFKEHMFEPLLSLHADPVANIRLRLCPLLPQLKTHIKLPSDRNLLQLLESCVRQLLLNEKDRDVTSAIQKAVESLDKVQVQMESLTKKAFLEEDIADIKKEEEEQDMIIMEEREKKEEEAKSLKGERKKDKKDSGSKIPGPKPKSRIPAATPVRDKNVGSASSTSSRGEKNGAIPKDVKKSPTASNKPDKAGSGSRLPKSSPTTASSGSLRGSPRIGQRPSQGSAGPSRKSSNTSIGSSSSISSTNSPSISSLRRGSTGSSGNNGSNHVNAASKPDLPRRTSPTTRRTSTGSVGSNGPTRKKSLPPRS